MKNHIRLSFTLILTVMGLSACFHSDSDGPPPRSGFISFDSESASVNESAGNISINIGRGAGNKGDDSEPLADRVVSVDYRVVAGTATENSDYTATSGTLEWAGGLKTVYTIDIAIIDDSLVEGAEVFTVVLENVQGEAALGYASLTVTINDDDSATPPQVAAPDTYAFYTTWDGGNSAYNLFAVDPADHSVTPVQLSGSNLLVRNEGVHLVEGGTFDAASETISGRHTHALFLLGKDQKMYMLNAKKEVGNTLTPVQLSSSTTHATSQCVEKIFSNYDDENATQILISEEPMAMCVGTVDKTNFRLLTLSTDSATAASVITGRVLAPLRNYGTGLVSNYLIQDGANLYTVDSAFSNASAGVDVSNFTQIWYEGQAPGRFILKMVDANGETLKAFNVANNSLVDIDTILAPKVFQFTQVYNGGNSLAYAVTEFGGVTTIHKVDLTTTPYSPSQVADEGNNLVEELMTNGEYVAFVSRTAGADFPKYIRTVAADNTLTTLTSYDNNYLGLVGLSETHAFYEVRESYGTVTMAGAAKLDGSAKVETADAIWAAVQFQNTQSISRASQFRNDLVGSMVKSSGIGVGVGTSYWSVENTPLTGYSSDNVAGISLGTVPSDIRKMSSKGYGNYIMSKGWPAAGSEILTITLDTENSIQRITSDTTNHDPVIQ